MSAAGSTVFANLATLFAIGIAFGLARSDKGTAGLSAFLALMIMNATINVMLKLPTHWRRKIRQASGKAWRWVFKFWKRAYLAAWLSV